jgi:hypothetical protein
MSTDNCTKVTATMENLFVESPAHRAQLFGALHRATERADDRQDTPTALPDVSAPSIAPEALRLSAPLETQLHSLRLSPWPVWTAFFSFELINAAGVFGKLIGAHVAAAAIDYFAQTVDKTPQTASAGKIIAK